MALADFFSLHIHENTNFSCKSNNLRNFWWFQWECDIIQYKWYLKNESTYISLICKKNKKQMKAYLILLQCNIFTIWQVLVDIHNFLLKLAPLCWIGLHVFFLNDNFVLLQNMARDASLESLFKHILIRCWSKYQKIEQ